MSAISHALDTIEKLQRERDDARAEVERYRRQYQLDLEDIRQTKKERDEALAAAERLKVGIRCAARGKCSRPGCDNSIPVASPWCSVACMDEHTKADAPMT